MSQSSKLSKNTNKYRMIRESINMAKREIDE